MSQIIKYSIAVEDFSYNAYSNDFRMQKFAQANVHCSDVDIINELEQELYDFSAETDCFDKEKYLQEAQHYIDLLKYRVKRKQKFADAINK